MERYDVYMHNVPKVSEDGQKVIPIEGHQKKDFTALEEAQKCAADNKDKFERVVLIRTVEEKQRLIERYIDGVHEVNQKPEETEEKE